jgi:nucleotide-binding universal stress UspA family protein
MTMSFQRILVTLDGSPLAEQALELAVSQAEHHGSELVLLRVVSPMAKSYRAGSGSVAAIETVERQLVQLARDYVESVAARLRERDIPVRVAVRVGNPNREILQSAKDNAVDLVVMTTRGETGFSRWLLGSVTDHIVRAAKVPVLVVPVWAQEEVKGTLPID